MKIQSYLRTRRRFPWLVSLFLACTWTFTAYGQGADGIREATGIVQGYFEPAVTLMYSVAAVLGLVGGVKVYSKFSSGDPDTSKAASAWLGACIFLVVVATVLRSFFVR